MSQGSIKISGNGFINSGIYDTISIMGDATSKGEVEAQKVSIMGDADFNGNVNFKEFIVRGDAKIKGDLKAEKVKVTGDLRIEGDCKIGDLAVSGDVDIVGELEAKIIDVKGDLYIEKQLRAEKIKIYGDIKAGSDINCEEIKIEGKIICEGLLNAEEVHIHSYAQSYCKEIGASKISVIRPAYHFLWLSFHKNCSLKCDVIEGDEIELENAEVKIVRGKNINLIKYCKIGTVEYSGDYKKGNNVEVNETIKAD